MPLLGHPLTDPGGLEVPPVVAAVLAMLLVAAVARFWPGPARAREPSSEGDRVHSWWGGLRPLQVAGRVLALGGLVLAVAAGRLGDEDELANIAPALVVGVAWPLVLLGCAVLGPVWRWLDPWDGAARLVRSESQTRATASAWVAVVPALAWTWYLGAFSESLDPRNVGLALGVYSALSIAGCLVLGRAPYLSRAETFGLLFGWTARLPRGLLPGWSPPRGAEAVLGTLAGGLLFGTVRLSTLWGSLNVAEEALAYATIGVAAGALGVAGLLVACGWWSERAGAGGAVAACSVPAVMSVAIALSMARNRLTTSLQLLPGLIVDPFGSQGGPLARGTLIDPDPFGATGLLAIQVGLVVAGGIAGAIVLARRAEVASRAPAMAALCLVTGTAVAALTAV
jgi:hypothetical protein